jgi:hypothetical protein
MVGRLARDELYQRAPDAPHVCTEAVILPVDDLRNERSAHRIAAAINTLSKNSSTGTGNSIVTADGTTKSREKLAYLWGHIPGRADGRVPVGLLAAEARHGSKIDQLHCTLLSGRRTH